MQLTHARMNLLPGVINAMNFAECGRLTCPRSCGLAHCQRRPLTRRDGHFENAILWMDKKSFHTTEESPGFVRFPNGSTDKQWLQPKVSKMVRKKMDFVHPNVDVKTNSLSKAWCSCVRVRVIVCVLVGAPTASAVSELGTVGFQFIPPRGYSP